MEKVLVTGGAGYIGSILVPKLLDEGYKVTVLDNLMYAQNSLLDVCAHENFDFIAGDARDKNLLKKAARESDYVVPLAAIVGAPACAKDIERSRSINFQAVVSLTEILSSEQRVIFPVTNSGYGIGESGKFCDEESPLRPISQYGKDKVAAEEVLLSRGNAVTFRLATVFGASPRMRLDLLVNDFTYRAINDGSIVLFEPHFKRNYIHVRDIANAFLFAMKNFDSMNGETYNHGLEDANLSKLELCETIKEFIPRFEVFVSETGEDPDKRDYIVSNSKLAATGYKNSHSLNDGVKELIKVYKIIRKFGFDNL